MHRQKDRQKSINQKRYTNMQSYKYIVYNSTCAQIEIHLYLNLYTVVGSSKSSWQQEEQQTGSKTHNKHKQTHKQTKATQDEKNKTTPHE